MNRRQSLLKLIHLSLDEARGGYVTARRCVWKSRNVPLPLATAAFSHLELGLGAAAELDSDGEQRLVDAGLGQLVAVALPALLQPLEATLAHGQQGQGRGQVAPLPLRPESTNVEGESRRNVIRNRRIEIQESLEIKACRSLILLCHSVWTQNLIFQEALVSKFTLLLCNGECPSFAGWREHESQAAD